MGELLRVQKIVNRAVRLIGEMVNRRKNYLQVLDKFIVTHECYFYTKMLFLIAESAEEIADPALYPLRLTGG